MSSKKTIKKENFKNQQLVHLSTAVGSKYSNRTWVNIQSARWVNIQSARTKNNVTNKNNAIEIPPKIL